MLVFREERKQAAGLKAIQRRQKTKFTLLSDLGAKATKPYSNKRGEFATYVIDNKGVVRTVFPGTKGRRPDTNKVLAAIQKLPSAKAGSKSKAGSDTKKTQSKKSGSGTE